MSFKAMSWAASVKTKTSTQKLILLLLADRSNDDGFCFPSLQTIADDACMSRQCVIENIKKLAGHRLISVTRRTISDADSGQTRNTSNIYKLNTEVVNEVDHRPKGVVNVVDHPSQRRLLGVVNEVDSNLSSEPTNESDIYVEGSHKTPVEDSPIPPTPGSAPPPSPAENERKRAKELEATLLADISRAKGRKLISKPTGEGIYRLLKTGVTEQEVIRAINWLYENARDPYCPVVESGKSLYDKWDKVQAGMARSGYSGSSGHKERAVLKNGVLYFVDKPKCESQYMRTNYLPEHDAQYEILTPEQFKGAK